MGAMGAFGEILSDYNLHIGCMSTPKRYLDPIIRGMSIYLESIAIAPIGYKSKVLSIKLEIYKSNDLI